MAFRGLGSAAVAFLQSSSPPRALSVVATAPPRIPLTVHVRSAPTSSTCTRRIRAASRGPSRLPVFVVSNVARLGAGLPQLRLRGRAARVFSRRALARNRGCSLDGLVTVNLDFMRLYRPQTNVVHGRPWAWAGGTHCGHHELLIPLLAGPDRMRLRPS